MTLQDSDASSAPAPAPAVPGRFAGTIASWVAKHLNGTVVSRDTEAFNFLRSKLAALDAMLEQEHGQ